MSSFYDDASLVVIPSGYKTSKVYAEKPTDGSGDLAFTRTGDTATRVNSAGLIEKVRTNLALYSEDFTNASWTKSVTVTANAGTAPNGTTTADLIYPSANSSNSVIFNGVTIANSTEYTNSIYVKASGKTWTYIRGINDGVGVWFDVANGVLGTTQSGVSGTITSVGSGWYRCSVTQTSSSTTGRLVVLVVDGDGSTAVTASGTNGLLIWGAQIETGVETSYIPTLTAAVSTGPTANVPRLDYLGSTCGKLLLEPQRTNWVRYSERLEIGYAFAYVDGLTITQNTTETLDPFGYYGAEKFQTTTGGKRADSYSGAMSGLQQVHSIFAKAGTANSITIECLGASGTQFAATFNLTNGTVTSTSGTPTVSGVQSYGNGWYRCYVGGIGSTSAHVKGVVVIGTGSVYMTGWMWEEGNYPTSYIGATLGAAVTRGADACSKTGISSLIGQTEGTLFVDFDFNGNYDANGLVAIDVLGAGNNEAYIFITGAGQLRLELYVAGALQCSITSSIGAIGRKKIAFAYKANDFVGYMNGVQVGTDTSGTVGTMDTIYVGTYQSPTYATGNMNQTLLFKTRLTNASLAELTSL